MRVFLKASFVAAMFGVTTPALAGPYYFHRAGVERDRFVEDVEICRELSGAGRANKTTMPYNANIYAAMAGAFIGGFLNSRVQRKHESAIERICMADKGYTRVAIPKSEFKRIRALDDDTARLEALHALASSTKRLGEELPE